MAGAAKEKCRRICQDGRHKQWKIELEAIIPRLTDNFNLSSKIAVLAKEPYSVNGFKTRLLEVDRERFRIDSGKHGLRHVSGAFFSLDCATYRAAARFMRRAVQ